APRPPPHRGPAQKLFASRTSVREALRALESRGRIEIRPGEGTFVRQVPLDALVGPLALVMTSQREAIGELFEARRVLEPAIAALAAGRATPEEIHEMERILEDQAREIAAGKSGLAPDGALHAAIGTAAPHPRNTAMPPAGPDLPTPRREERADH